MFRSVNILLAAVALVASVNGQLTTTIDDKSVLWNLLVVHGSWAFD